MNSFKVLYFHLVICKANWYFGNWEATEVQSEFKKNMIFFFQDALQNYLLIVLQ